MIKIELLSLNVINIFYARLRSLR